VLYDAVAVMISPEGAEALLKDAAAKDFVSDAFGHLKFIAYIDAAMPLLEKAGIAPDLDAGCVILNGPKNPDSFVKACRKLRRWDRETDSHAVMRDFR
jgi:catalase